MQKWQQGEVTRDNNKTLEDLMLFFKPWRFCLCVVVCKSWCYILGVDIQNVFENLSPGSSAATELQARASNEQRYQTPIGGSKKQRRWNGLREVE